MADLLAKILHSISQDPAIAAIVAALITGIAMWISRPKPAKEYVEPRVEIVRSTETLEITVRTTRTVEEQRITVGKR